MKTLIKFLSILLIFVPLIKLSAQNPTFEWAQKIGGSNNDRVIHHVTDVHGNIYMTGYFRNTVDFDPGVNTSFLTSNGINDIFIAKHDAAGNYKWAHAFGNIFNDEGHAITLDNEGNVIITGYFQDTIDFDPGPAIANLSAVGLDEVFILKLDTNGNYIWAKRIGGAGSETGNAIDTDSAGNVFTVGKFEGTADFDPGPGTSSLTSNGRDDIYVSKLDKNGNFIWAKQMGGSFWDAGLSISVDPSGFVYTTGYFHGTADFNPDSSVNNLTSNGDDDIFISKLDSNGNYIWAKSFGGNANDVAYTVLTDRSKYVYLTGYFRNTVDFDPGSGTLNLTSNGFTDIFMLKLDTSANLEWVKGFGGSRGDYGRDIAIDHEGNLYFSSTFRGTVDFNTGSGVNNLTSNASGADIAILKVDSNANFLWARNFGNGSSNPSAISIDSAKNIVTSGSFTSRVDFDPGSGTHNIRASGEDGFIMKLSQCSDNAGTDIIDACVTYTWIDGITYTSSNNTATYTLTNTGGCDSLVHLNLTINQATSSIISDTACDRYTWSLNNITYLRSGSYQDTILNIKGCDSIITLDLNIDSTSTSTQIISACDSFYWTQTNIVYFQSGLFEDTLVNHSNCDSIIILDLTINNSTRSTTTVVACDNYLWQNNNQTYTSSGLYKDTVSSSFGCDSIITLILTINHSSNSTHLMNSCDTYLSPSSKYLWSSSGVYQDTIQALNGCDSILTIDLTILKSSYDTITVTRCDTFISSSSKIYTTSNTFNDTVLNSVGCDSIIITNLSILSNKSSIGPSVCGTYVSPSGKYSWDTTGTYLDTLQNRFNCDSIITINLTTLQSKSSIQVIACDSFISPSAKTFTSSGIYYDTIINHAACDSIIIISLSINHSTSATLKDSACNEYLSPSGKYSWTSNGVYLDTIANSNGCDSLLTLDIVILQPTSSTINLTSCDSLIAPSGAIFFNNGLFKDTINNNKGCDSIITFFLTLNKSSKKADTITACNNYTLPSGSLVLSSGSYMDTLQSSQGCDSIINTKLTIQTIDTSVTRIGNQLISNQNNATYQWLDCNASYSVLLNDTNQGLTPTFNGSYAVEVTNSCSDTSRCYSVLTVSINEQEKSNSKINVYPNPTKDRITIELELDNDNRYIQLYDLTNKLLNEIQVYSNKTSIDISTYSKGVYILRYGITSKKLIIQ